MLISRTLVPGYDFIFFISVQFWFISIYFIDPMNSSCILMRGTDLQFSRIVRSWAELIFVLFIRLFTNRPHVSTSPAEKDIGSYLAKTWSDYGFQVEESEYQVPISLPSDDKPNMITIINNDTKTVEYTIKGQINVRYFKPTIYW